MENMVSAYVAPTLDAMRLRRGWASDPQRVLSLGMERFLSRILAALLISLLTLTSSAQQAAPLSKKTAAVKRKVDTLTPHAPISVIPIHAEEEYGNFVSGNAEGFTFYDVDRKTEVTLKYADVQKIKDGY